MPKTLRSVATYNPGVGESYPTDPDIGSVSPPSTVPAVLVKAGTISDTDFLPAFPTDGALGVNTSRNLFVYRSNGQWWSADMTFTGTAAPTTGAYVTGQQIRNTAPVEVGTAGSKYIVTGWVCVTSGSPGIWLPIRTQTGN